MNNLVIPVILSGGSGTRLWPLSRKALPKQFAPLIPSKESGAPPRSLLAMTLGRASMLSDTVIIVAAEEHRFLVQEAVASSQVTALSILEPVGRDTAAAIAVAALNADPDSVLLFMPADHHIPDEMLFTSVMKKGITPAREGYIVTFGVTPHYPSTAYGYIQRGDDLADEVSTVTQFIEKPPAKDAEAMLFAGGYFWNAGIFMAKASTMTSALRQYCPDVLDACQRAVALQHRDHDFVRLGHSAFEACPRISIDYAVLEHHDNVAMVRFEGQWSDVGSWREVAKLTPPDTDGNRIQGKGLGLHAEHTFIYAPHRPVVALGTRNLLIVDTPDALLVASEDFSEHVKQAVAALEREGVPQAVQHRRVARPWGSYDSVDAGERFKVKRISVNPGTALSLQMHHHRAEHWVVVSGTAKVTRGDETFLLTENQSTYIPLGQTHRLANPGKTPLEIIEIQSGAYLGEDDIVRFEDSHGRVTSTSTDSEKK